MIVKIKILCHKFARFMLELDFIRYDMYKSRGYIRFWQQRCFRISHLPYFTLEETNISVGCIVTKYLRLGGSTFF